MGIGRYQEGWSKLTTNLALPNFRSLFIRTKTMPEPDSFNSEAFKNKFVKSEPDFIIGSPVERIPLSDEPEGLFRPILRTPAIPGFCGFEQRIEHFKQEQAKQYLIHQENMSLPNELPPSFESTSTTLVRQQHEIISLLQQELIKALKCEECYDTQRVRELTGTIDAQVEILKSLTPKYPWQPESNRLATLVAGGVGAIDASKLGWASIEQQPPSGS